MNDKNNDNNHNRRLMGANNPTEEGRKYTQRMSTHQKIIHSKVYYNLILMHKNIINTKYSNVIILSSESYIIKLIC